MTQQRNITVKTSSKLIEQIKLKFQLILPARYAIIATVEFTDAVGLANAK